MPHSESEYPPRPVSGRMLRRSEVTAIALCYFPLNEVDNAVDVARLESAWHTDAWNNDGEDSRGLWQINVVAAAHPELAAWNLFDPTVCAYFAAPSAPAPPAHRPSAAPTSSVIGLSSGTIAQPAVSVSASHASQLVAVQVVVPCCTPAGRCR